MPIEEMLFEPNPATETDLMYRTIDGSKESERVQKETAAPSRSVLNSSGCALACGEENHAFVKSAKPGQTRDVPLEM